MIDEFISGYNLWSLCCINMFNGLFLRNVSQVSRAIKISREDQWELIA